MQKAGKNRQVKKSILRNKKKKELRENPQISHPEKIQQIAKNCDFTLSPPQLQKLKSQHQSLVTFDLLLAKIEILSEFLKEQLKIGSNSTYVPIIRHFISENIDWIKSNRQARVEMVSSMKGAISKADPKDTDQQDRTIKYRNGILQAKDIYDRKKAFPKYSTEHINIYKELIEHQINQSVGEISEQAADRYFSIYHQCRKRKNAEVQAQYKRLIQQEMISIFNNINDDNEMMTTWQKVKREKKIQNEIDLKDAISDQIGDSKGYYLSIFNMTQDL